MAMVAVGINEASDAAFNVFLVSMGVLAVAGIAAVPAVGAGLGVGIQAIINKFESPEDQLEAVTEMVKETLAKSFVGRNELEAMRGWTI